MTEQEISTVQSVTDVVQGLEKLEIVYLDIATLFRKQTENNVAKSTKIPQTAFRRRSHCTVPCDEL